MLQDRKLDGAGGSLLSLPQHVPHDRVVFHLVIGMQDRIGYGQWLYRFRGSATISLSHVALVVSGSAFFRFVHSFT